MLSCLLFVANTSWAQQVPPSSVTPEHIEKGLQQPYIEPQQTPAAPVIGLPKAPPTGKLAAHFTLYDVKIEGSTVYEEGTFDPLFENNIGKNISLAQAQEIARGVTARYRADGYVLSQAIIPTDQELRDGVLHVKVIEGFIDRVIIQNDNPKADSRDLIAGFARKIQEEKPLNTATLERYMLLIDDLPGVSARSVIRPSPSTFGAADLVIEIQNKREEASFTSDNRGNRYLGPYQEQLTLTENSALGLGERTTVRGLNSLPISELHYIDIQHEEQIGSEGTHVIFFASKLKTNPGDILKPANFRGDSEDYSVTLASPLLRSRAENFTGRVMLDARNSENDVLGFQLYNDRVRALRVGSNYSVGDHLGGVVLFDGLVSQGVGGLGATADGAGRSRFDADSSFSKFNFDLSRLQNLPHGFSVLTAATGQYTLKPLLTSEQFTLGGVGFGQAYDSGELSGDEGVAGKLELRYGQGVGQKWLDSYQLYAAYDIGTVRLYDPSLGTPAHSQLSSLSTGVRLNFTQNLYGYLELGLPLTKDVASEGNKDPRLFFSLTGRY